MFEELDHWLTSKTHSLEYLVTEEAPCVTLERTIYVINFSMVDPSRPDRVMFYYRFVQTISFFFHTSTEMIYEMDFVVVLLLCFVAARARFI